MHVDDQAGQRIRQRRIELNKTQADLVRPGLSPTYLSLIESGQRRPTVAVLRSIAEALDTTPEHLATGQHPVKLVAAEEQLVFAEVQLHNGEAHPALRGFDAIIATLAPAAAGPAATLVRRARTGRAQALEALGELDSAVIEYDALWRETAAGTVLWAEVGVHVLRVHRLAGDVDYSASAGEQALATFEALQLSWTDEVVRLGVTLAGVYLHRGDLTRAATLLHRLIGIADEMGSPLARGSAYWNACLAAAQRGHHGDAIRFAERALALFGETDRARNLAQLHHTYGELLVRQDQAAAGQRHMQKALAQLTLVGSSIDIAICENGLASAALALGDVAQARQRVESTLRRLPEGTGPLVRAEAHLLRALAHQADGDTDTARAGLLALEADLDGQTGWDATEIWHTVATVWERLGEAEHALRAYRSALSCSGRTPRPLPAALESPKR
ncbi:MAG TPA: helix-turn-helix domain-containing protein [Candidatus Limnocylindrales bacterium]|nr:helix-turn-helix domain-containing protein [Candidatus Limnocylindrales bacterium]